MCAQGATLQIELESLPSAAEAPGAVVSSRRAPTPPASPQAGVLPGRHFRGLTPPWSCVLMVLFQGARGRGRAAGHG